MKKNAPHFHILALSGGGYRGLYSAEVLKQLEERWQCSLGKRFDLICGTSIGGILALACALEIPFETIVRCFLKNGEKIFPRSRWGPMHGLAKPRYSNDGLRTTLHEIFGDARIRDLTVPVVIPSVNFTKGSGQFFKTPHHPSLQLDSELLLVDVALATSAAPIYFPMHKMNAGLFVDGGLVC